MWGSWALLRLLLLAQLGQRTGAALIEYEFNVTYFKVNADGRESMVLGVNEQVPGPMIRCREGDTLRVCYSYALSVHLWVGEGLL